MSQEDTSYVLPPSLITQRDLRRLVTEVERLDSEFLSRDIHENLEQQSSGEITMSTQLEDFLAANQLNIHDQSTRSQLLGRLRELKESVPVVHITFAASAGPEELSKLVAWVRQSVHAQAVFTVGLQPALIGGAYIRTANRVFDLSVRSQLANGRQIIVKELEALRGAN